MRGSNPYALTLALLGACTGEPDTPEPLGSLEPWVDVLVEQPVAGFAPGGGSEVVFSAAGQSQLWTSVATPEVISVTGAAPLFEVADLMRRKRIHRVLVIEDGELRGIVSSLDVVGVVADRRLGSP